MTSAAQVLRSVWHHPANAHARLRAVARALAWQLSKRVLGTAWDIDFHGARLRCHPDSPVGSGAIYFNGMPDWWEMQFLVRFLRPGDGFIDVGANIGLYSVLAAAKVGPQGRVDAFEPGERSAGRIEDQVRLNGFGNLRIHRLAVSDRAGELQFGWSDNDAMAHVQRAGESGPGGRSVPAIRLDEFEPYGPYAAGKMDIEGGEPMALAGARLRLAACDPPVWLLELAGYSRLYGVESHDLVAWLAEAGFDCAVYHPARGTLEYTDRPWELGAQNALAIARSHRGFVEDRLRAAPPSTPA